MKKVMIIMIVINNNENIIININEIMVIMIN